MIEEVEKNEKKPSLMFIFFCGYISGMLSGLLIGRTHY